MGGLVRTNSDLMAPPADVKSLTGRCAGTDPHGDLSPPSQARIMARELLHMKGNSSRDITSRESVEVSETNHTGFVLLYTMQCDSSVMQHTVRSASCISGSTAAESQFAPTLVSSAVQAW